MNMRKHGSASVPACEIVLRRKRRRSRYIACAMICFVVTSPGLAQTDADFTKANEEFAQGHFKEAIAGYEALVSAGQWNPNLFYDLGKAILRTMEFRRVSLNYDRVLDLHRH